MLPLVERNLRRAGLCAAELAPLRAHRLRTTVTNERMFRACVPAVRALAEAGIAVVLLKGTAIALRHYDDIGLRPMGDIDVLVRPGDAERAVAVLTGQGLQPKTPLSPRRISLVHAEDFSDAAGRHIDLHWRLYPQRPGDTAGLFERARSLDFYGVSAFALSPADELLHVLVHGLHWSPEATLRWASDAAAILAERVERLQWDVFVGEAQRLRLVAPAREGLGYLAGALGVPVPREVCERLASTRVPRSDAAEFRLGCRRATYTVLGGIPVFAFQYARDARALSRTPHPLGFLRYMAEYWGYASTSAVLRRMAVRAALRAWSRLSGRALPPPDPV